MLVARVLDGLHKPDRPKDYVVLCHGRVSAPELTLRQPLYWAEGTHLPTVVRGATWRAER